MDSGKTTESDLRDLALKRKQQRNQTEEFVALQYAVAIHMAMTEEDRIQTARDVLRYLSDPQLELVKRDLNKRMSAKKKGDARHAQLLKKKKR